MAGNANSGRRSVLRPPAQELREVYARCGGSRGAAQHYGVSGTTILAWLRYYGLQHRRRGGANNPTGYNGPRMSPYRKHLRALVDEQAEDAGLWFMAHTAQEAYLQAALRRLHAAVEEDGKVMADEAAQTCSRCKHFYAGRCEAPMPLWFEQMDPLGHFAGERTVRPDDDGCKVWKRKHG